MTHFSVAQKPLNSQSPPIQYGERSLYGTNLVSWDQSDKRYFMINDSGAHLNEQKF